MLLNKQFLFYPIALSFFYNSALAADLPVPPVPPFHLVVDNIAYTHAQQMVEIEPGRRLNLYCIGTGSPTIVLESGLGAPMSNWGLIQPTLATYTRTCAYDRAGLGFSDAGKRPSTSANIVDDLHLLLQKAKINPPFLIVGHSLGGMTVRLFATTYPNEVVGMVLVDPTVEDQTEGYRGLDPERRTAAQWHAAHIAPDIQQGKSCVAAAPKGFIMGTELFKNCISEPSQNYSAAINASNQQQEMRLATQQAGLSETEHAFASSSDQVRASPRSMGNLPLIVLTRGPRPPLPQTEAQALRLTRAKMQVNLHVDVANLSTRGTQKIVVGSGHFIQMDKPQAVIDAISTVLVMQKQ